MEGAERLRPDCCFLQTVEGALAGDWSCCSAGDCRLKAVCRRRIRATVGEEEDGYEDFLDSSLGMEGAEACAVLVFRGGKACVGSCSPDRY